MDLLDLPLAFAAGLGFGAGVDCWRCLVWRVARRTSKFTL